MKRFAMFAAAMALCAGSVFAGEKDVMHCFAFTVVEGATPDQWAAFSKATNELPGKIKGIKRVWHGKLARPLTVGDAKRQHGVCMEFSDMAAYQAYGKDPAHSTWVSSYEKVRVAGTTTFQIQGE